MDIAMSHTDSHYTYMYMNLSLLSMFVFMSFVLMKILQRKFLVVLAFRQLGEGSICFFRHLEISFIYGTNGDRQHQHSHKYRYKSDLNSQPRRENMKAIISTAQLPINNINNYYVTNTGKMVMFIILYKTELKNSHISTKEQTLSIKLVKSGSRIQNYYNWDPRSFSACTRDLFIYFNDHCR